MLFTLSTHAKRHVKLCCSICLAAVTLSLMPSGADAQANAPGTITLQSLVERMVNRDAVAEFPGYANVTGEETSKDPRAREVAGYFYADDDGGNFQRDVVISGRTEHVMVDVTGPGAMTRFFVAGPSFAGHTIRFYLDGSTTPVLTSDLNTLMTGGSFVGTPFVYASGPANINTPYSGTVPSGLNLYLPIPFAKQMLITYDGPDNVSPTNQPAPILDFVWEYERFTPATTVVSFEPSQFTSNKTALATYYTQLSATANTTLPTATAYTNSSATTFFNANLAAGASATYTLPSGANALRLLQANVGTSSAALEGINLTISFDGDAYAVDAPIGNFFGTGPAIHPGTTQMQSVGSNGTMTSRWTMPWQSSASITIKNTTSAAIPVFLSGVVAAYSWDASSMHFHAYRRINGPQYMHNQIHTMRMMDIAGTGSSWAITRWWSKRSPLAIARPTGGEKATN